MSRLESLLRLFTEGKYVEQLNGHTTQRRAEILANMQARYDHLAGVPGGPLMTEWRDNPRLRGVLPGTRQYASGCLPQLQGVGHALPRWVAAGWHVS